MRSAKIIEFFVRHPDRWQFLFMAAALALAMAVLLGIYLVPIDSTSPLTEAGFRAREWDLRDVPGNVHANLLKLPAQGSFAVGLRGKFGVEAGNTLVVTLDTPPQKITFTLSGVFVHRDHLCVPGRNEQLENYYLCERMPRTRKTLLYLVIALTFFAVLVRIPVLITRAMTLPEALALGGIVFLALAAYCRFLFSYHVNGLSWWMRETAFHHVKSGLAYTKGLDVASDSPAPLSLGTLGGHHPPGLGLFLAGLYGLFGFQEQDLIIIWVVPLFFHGLGAASFYLLMRNWSGPAQGLCALAVYLFLPLSIWHGRVASHESVTMGLAMTGLYFAVAYLRNGSRARLSAALLSLAGACAAGWPAFFYCAMIGLGVCFFPDAPLARRRILFQSLGAISSGILLLLLAQHKVFLGTIDALLQAGSRRIGSGGLEEFGYASYTWSEWVDKVLDFAVHQTFGLPLICCAALGALLLARRWDRQGWHGGGWVFMVTAAVAMLHLVLFHFGSWVHDYWTFYCIPPVAIAISSLPFEAFQHRSLRIASVLAVGVVMAYTLQRLLPALGAY